MRPALPETNRQDATVQVEIPTAATRGLNVFAASSGETMRIYVLKALAAYGIDVPADALVDPRRAR